MKQLIDTDARYTVEELAQISGISLSSVYRILTDRLGLKKVCARWVPHLLTQEQKEKRVELAKAVVEKFDRCDNRRLMEIVTGDETWIHHFDPENKEKKQGLGGI